MFSDSPEQAVGRRVDDLRGAIRDRQTTRGWKNLDQRLLRARLAAGCVVVVIASRPAVQLTPRVLASMARGVGAHPSPGGAVTILLSTVSHLWAERVLNLKHA